MSRTQPRGGQILDDSITHDDVATANKDGAAATPSLRTLGTGAQQAMAGNDSRVTGAAVDSTVVHIAGAETITGVKTFAGTVTVFGPGDGATPGQAILRGPAAVGTDIAGATMIIDASNGTGLGGSGSIRFRTAPPGVTGATVNTLAEAGRITPTGDWQFAQRVGLPTVRSDSWFAISGAVPSGVTGANNTGMFFDPSFALSAITSQQALEFRVKQVASGSPITVTTVRGILIDPMVVGTNWTVTVYADLQLSDTTGAGRNVGILLGAFPSTGNWITYFNSAKQGYLGTGNWGFGQTAPASPVDISVGTITATRPALNAIGTWNAGGVSFTHLLANVTDTASGAGSLLIDLQIGGVSKFKVDKAGNATCASLTITGTQTANTVFAGPASGANAAATFRATVPADLTPAFPALRKIMAGRFI